MDKQVKLILLDLDGTLLDENSKVPASFSSLIQRCKEIGVHIGIASGRNRSSLENVFGPLFETMCCVTNNGCANYIEGKLSSYYYIDLEDCKKIYDYSKENGISFLLHKPEHILLEKGDPSIPGLNKVGFNTKEVEDLPSLFEASVLISLIDHTGKDHKPDLGKVEGNFQMASPATGIIDVTPKGISKATGARMLADSLGITMDNIMAFGDAGNDLDLLKHVGYPVAMKNGTDEVKAVAKYITPLTNADHGVIHFIEEFFNL